MKDLIAFVTGCRPGSTNFILADKDMFSQMTHSRSSWWVSSSLEGLRTPAARKASSQKGTWSLLLAGFLQAAMQGRSRETESRALSIILKETKYLIVRSGQTHCQRQMSLTPWYPRAQSILIKIRFWLLHGSELWVSFTDRCPRTEAAGTISDVQLRPGASPPAPPGTSLPPALLPSPAFLSGSKPSLPTAPASLSPQSDLRPPRGQKQAPSLSTRLFSATNH